MNTKELKVLIQAAEDLGHDDVRLGIDDSRDGKWSVAFATAHLEKCGTQQDPNVMLVFRHSNG